MIIQPVDNGNKPHPFGHAVVAGIERYPSKITRRMSKTRQEKRSKIKPFIKVINYNHLMPTRYTLELEGLKGTISGETFKEVSQREDAKKTVKKVLEERYTSGKNRWFFTPLSTSLSASFLSPPPLSREAKAKCPAALRLSPHRRTPRHDSLANSRLQNFKGSFSPSRLGSWRDVKSIEWHLMNPGLWAQYEVIKRILHISLHTP